MPFRVPRPCKNATLQQVTGDFPTHRNREFLRPQQGSPPEEQGSHLVETGKALGGKPELRFLTKPVDRKGLSDQALKRQVRRVQAIHDGRLDPRRERYEWYDPAYVAVGAGCIASNLLDRRAGLDLLGPKMCFAQSRDRGVIGLARTVSSDDFDFLPAFAEREGTFDARDTRLQQVVIDAEVQRQRSAGCCQRKLP